MVGSPRKGIPDARGREVIKVFDWLLRILTPHADYALFSLLKCISYFRGRKGMEIAAMGDQVTVPKATSCTHTNRRISVDF